MPERVLDDVSIVAGEQSDAETALAIIDQFSAPAPMRVLIDLVTLMKIGCKSRAEGEKTTETQLKFYADALGRYPADIATSFVRQWCEEQIFFPALAEVHQHCKRAMTVRRSVQDRLALYLSGVAQLTKSREIVTPQEAEKIRARIKLTDREETPAPQIDPETLERLRRVDETHGDAARAKTSKSSFRSIGALAAGAVRLEGK